MNKLSDIKLSDSITLLLYGAAGVGKTEFCGSACLDGDAGIINAGLGIVTLQSPGFKKRHPGVNPYVKTITETPLPDSAVAYDLCCDAMDEFLEMKEVKTIILDDVTSLRRFAMNKGLEVNQSENRSQSHSKSKAKGIILKNIQDYGAEMDLIAQFIIAYTGLCKEAKKHLIIVAHERVEYIKPVNSQGAPLMGVSAVVSKVRPGFTGQTFPDDITGHFDLVWYMDTLGSGTQRKYRINTESADKFVAKTRWSGLFEPVIYNPNFLEVKRKIEEATK